MHGAGQLFAGAALCVILLAKSQKCDFLRQMLIGNRFHRVS